MFPKPTLLSYHISMTGRSPLSVDSIRDMIICPPTPIQGKTPCIPPLQWHGAFPSHGIVPLLSSPRPQWDPCFASVQWRYLDFSTHGTCQEQESSEPSAETTCEIERLDSVVRRRTSRNGPRLDENGQNDRFVGQISGPSKCTLAAGKALRAILPSSTGT